MHRQVNKPKSTDQPEEIVRTPVDRDWSGWVRAASGGLENTVQSVCQMLGPPGVRPRMRVLVRLQSAEGGRYSTSLTFDPNDEGHAARSLLGRLAGHLRQVPTPFAGEVHLTFLVASGERALRVDRHQVEIATERAPDDPDVRAVIADLRATLGEALRALKEKDQTMVRMFAASSDVIRSSGDALAAMRTRFGDALPPEVHAHDAFLTEATEFLRTLRGAPAAEAPDPQRAPAPEWFDDDVFEDIDFNDVDQTTIE